MADVFVSYKAEDRKRVAPLVEALEADGLSVWWDAQIGGGDEWRRSIEQQLDGAKCVLVVWSKRSGGPEGRFVRDEASRAMERGVYLPVRIDNVRLPLGFGETQALALTGWRGSAEDGRFQAVRGAVNAIVAGKPHEGHHLPHFETGVSRRGVIGGGAVAAAAIAGVGGWALLRPSATSASGSIAVLPFANLSGDPAQAYFSDGVAEEIRSALSRVAGLKVVGSSSSEAVRSDDAQTAAKKLGVANILTGSVRESPSTIRINAELIDGRSGIDRWSQDYDRSPGDSIRIQTDIAANVADALRIQLGGAAKAILTYGGTQNAAAQKLYLQADPGHGDESSEGLQRAIRDLDQAIRLDPNYAQAYARKTRTLAFYAAVYTNDSSEMAGLLGEAEGAAKQAVALAPRLPEGHEALSFVYRQQLKLKDSLREARISVGLPGATPSTHDTYAIIMGLAGHMNEALAAANDSAALDPLNPGAYETQAIVFNFAHRFAPCIAAARHGLQLASSRNYTRAILGYALIGSRRYDEAAAELSKLPADDVHAVMALSVIAWIRGDKARSDRLLEDMRGRFGESASYQFAQAYAQRRDADRAIESLRTSIEVRDPGLAAIKVDPFLDPIRNDPRLADVIRQLDFPA
jgi:TolB-like protein/tetratricopeptide (TPR) repeat protein